MTEPIIHIINLDRREDRAMSIIRQSKQIGFSVRFWEGVTSDTVAFRNINKAFRDIVQFAKEKNLDHITIGEDDLVFTSPNAWEHYLKNFPEDYDIYLAGIYSGQLDGNRVINGYSGHTLITVHQRFYDFFLSANPVDHIDRWLGNFAFEKKYIVCLPFCCVQMGGYSDNHRRIVSYGEYEREWEYLK